MFCTYFTNLTWWDSLDFVVLDLSSRLRYLNSFQDSWTIFSWRWCVLSPKGQMHYNKTLWQKTLFFFFSKTHKNSKSILLTSQIHNAFNNEIQNPKVHTKPLEFLELYSYTILPPVFALKADWKREGNIIFKLSKSCL